VAALDKVSQLAYDWFEESIEQALSGLSAADRPQVEPLLLNLLGLTRFPAPAFPDVADFTNSGAVLDSVAYALGVASESLAVLSLAQRVLSGDAAAGGMLAPLLKDVRGLLANSPERQPSALQLAKILLVLSGDAETPSPGRGEKAKKLATLVGGASAQRDLAIVTLLLGSIVDRTFAKAVPASNPGWAAPAFPPLAASPSLPIGGLPGLAGTLRFLPAPQSGIAADLNLGMQSKTGFPGGNFLVALRSNSPGKLFLPLGPAGATQATPDDFELRLEVSRPLTVGPVGPVSVQIGELGVALVLNKTSPSLAVFARQGQVRFGLNQDSLGNLVSSFLGERIEFDFSMEARADAFGKLRLKNGSGLQANLPVPSLATGPFTLELMQFELVPTVGADSLDLRAELSASFGVKLGPFDGTIHGLGVRLSASPPALALKLPEGIGLSLDAGVVKGGGYLAVSGSQFAGTLELKLLAIDVKAIVILASNPAVGYSLLLMIYGQFAPIQLSFGFVLTGVGGLIGVQHTADTNALSSGLGNGALDAILFPQNPVGDAPKIIETLKTLFPVRSGGFVIGPMLELGWGTPSLVTVRLGLLIEANQFLMLGQAIVQLPPMVEADLALLRLELDFLGSVVFDPLRLSFDAKLRNSRVAFLSITGQFAFRASFGSQPTFLISAGGFHPRFKEIPADIPVPFDRVGTSFNIGFIGVDFKGYFAITSATVQAGSDLRIWADLGVADIAGGWGFDAICYLKPKFYFEVDMHAFVTVHVLGEDFAGIHVDGLLAGPGRWHIAGRGTLEMSFVPDIHIDIDQSWGTDGDTPEASILLAEELSKEISAVSNWSAQLPSGGESYITLAGVKDAPDLLAHPLGNLTFTQKLIPLGLRLDKVSGSVITDANEYGDPKLVLDQTNGAAPPPSRTPQEIKDFFATAQFLEMTQEEKISKPSFESFAAGYTLKDDAFEVPTFEPVNLDYEVANLGEDSGPRAKLRKHSFAQTLFVQGVHEKFLEFGAAGRSTLRDKKLLLPPEDASIKVGPAPLTIVNKETLAAAPGVAVKTSYWQAKRFLESSGAVQPRKNQVFEVAELG
jgi:hypothetical protein